MASATKSRKMTAASTGMLWHALCIPWRSTMPGPRRKVAWSRGNSSQPVWMTFTSSHLQLEPDPRSMMSHTRSSNMRASRQISASLESFVRAEGHHRQAPKRWDPESGAEVAASRQLAASSLWACRSGTRSSSNASSPPN